MKLNIKSLLLSALMLFSVNLFANLSNEVEQTISLFKSQEAQAIIRKAFTDKVITMEQTRDIVNLEIGRTVVVIEKEDDSNQYIKGELFFVKKDNLTQEEYNHLNKIVKKLSTQLHYSSEEGLWKNEIISLQFVLNLEWGIDK